MKQFMKKYRFIFLGVLIVFIALGAYGFFIEPNQMEVTHLWIEDEAFSKPLKGRIAIHLSDLHLKTFGTREQGLIRVIDELRPDLIFLTGDYITWDGDYEVGIEFLSKLKATKGVYAVMGDYDYSNSRKSCLFCHEQGTGNPTTRHRVRFLRNNRERISLGSGAIWIAGMEKEEGPLADAGMGFDGCKDKDAAIILCHDPFQFEEIDETHKVLMLAGDTHGGQIPLPSWFWKLIGYEKNAEYNKGLYQMGSKIMYVSRGIGTSHLPVRLLRPPEIVVLHF